MSKLNFILIAAFFILYSIPTAGLSSITTDPTSQDPSPQSKVKVVASFYPILEFVKKVGGDRVEVSSLIPQGMEPHDFDPTVQQVQSVESADMLVYNGGGLEGPWIKEINAKICS
jgi:zinc transport system substrate-binding protein